jgi:uncharacterized protein
MQIPSSRLDLVDALRGFALVSIMLLHNIEHFDLSFVPPGAPAWLSALDGWIWDAAFFLFGGKSYAIFAMLFGVTFWLQCERRAAQGQDFRPRFAWRMFLLFVFGMVNALFYQGDILALYAVLALALLPVARLRDGALLAVAGLLLLQPHLLLEIATALPDPMRALPDPASWAYFGRANAYLADASLTGVMAGNLLNGRPGVVLWSWENGRLFQIPALFMLGMLAARRQLFAPTPANRRWWLRLLLAALAAFALLYAARTGAAGQGRATALWRPVATLLASWSNLAFMLVLVAAIALLSGLRIGARLLAAFRPLGRMSLTSYVAQSVVGTAIYYGWGLGWYKATGASACLLIGIALALLQAAFSAWWLRRHAQGPLEALWHRLTWLGTRRRVPRSSGVASATPSPERIES